MATCCSFSCNAFREHTIQHHQKEDASDLLPSFSRPDETALVGRVPSYPSLSKEEEAAEHLRVFKAGREKGTRIMVARLKLFGSTSFPTESVHPRIINLA